MAAPAKTINKPTNTAEKKPRVPVSYKKRAERSLSSLTRSVNSLERVMRAKTQGSPAQKAAFTTAARGLIERLDNALSIQPGAASVKSIIPDE